MPRKKHAIPVNELAGHYQSGIAVGCFPAGDTRHVGEAGHPHRHDSHIFLLAQTGQAIMEIDFEQHTMQAPAILYIHPSQVHRICSIHQAGFCILAMSADKINPADLQCLEQLILPARPLPLDAAATSLLADTIALAVTIFENRKDKLYTRLLQDYCNAFTGLVVAQYLEQQPATGNASRFDAVTREFKTLLERSFDNMKRPADYARALNLSVAYLNECVSNTTGLPVSHLIRQRILLEAKRLLCHSGKSVKEIAAALGYDDPAYFSRFFTKNTGISAIAFRSQNRG